MPFYVMRDQQALFVREFGQGKQPVLVLSGLGMKSWQWLPFLYPYRKDFHFIIPDWRGFGHSQNCQIPENLDAISSHWQDISDLLEHKHLNPFILIAYSMGATTAMHGMAYGGLQQHLKAYLHIDQSPKITVDESWSYGLFSDQHQIFKQRLQALSKLLKTYRPHQYIHELSAHERFHLIDVWHQLLEFQSSNSLFPTLFKAAQRHSILQSIVLPMQRLDYLAWYVDTYLYHDQDYRQALQQLSCPSTFFMGAQSKLYPITGQRLIVDSIDQAQGVEFDRSGHTPLVSEPKKFTQMIGQFLYQHTSSTSE
ncbi:alpha/beta fold hydrolase [Acinetobacter sp. MB5]|uniref:alpha/beta fold hydrolase n=1 Tax=Acinetobacter sp. MB5 TaxID=2069438 RepID=UPI000DCF7943|nr:alpha/beta hydrolase [Acinetobacter sp. MB5]